MIIRLLTLFGNKQVRGVRNGDWGKNVISAV